MVNIFSNLISTLVSMFGNILLMLLKALLIGLLPVVVSSLIYFIYYRIKGYKPIKSYLGVFKEHNILFKLFVELPSRIVKDYYTKDPNIFNEYGLWLVIGEQGSGKSMTMAYLLRKWQTVYKDITILSNMGYKYETSKFIDLSQLSLDVTNEHGEVITIDEVQTSFGIEYSTKFPENFKEVIHQLRKKHRCILGGSQNFDQIAKPLRCQCRYVLFPKTYLGCFTIVKQYKCLLDKDGLIDFKNTKPIKTFCFVHDDFLRDCYNSYASIDKISFEVPNTKKAV